MNEMDAAYNLVHDYPGGADSIAPRVGKAPSTLCHEVARLGTAKLGLQTAVKLSVASGDRRILEAFAAQCDCMILPLPARPRLTKINCLDQLGKLMSESGDVVQATLAGLARLVNGGISDNDNDQITRECADVVSNISMLLAAVRDMRDSGAEA